MLCLRLLIQRIKQALYNLFQMTTQRTTSLPCQVKATKIWNLVDMCQINDLTETEHPLRVYVKKLSNSASEPDVFRIQIKRITLKPDGTEQDFNSGVVLTPEEFLWMMGFRDSAGEEPMNLWKKHRCLFIKPTRTRTNDADKDYLIILIKKSKGCFVCPLTESEWERMLEIRGYWIEIFRKEIPSLHIPSTLEDSDGAEN